MKLLVISHTEHYKLPDGSVVGLGSTVMELNNLLDVFEEIFHLAMLHPIAAPANSLAYKSKIKFVPLPLVGGKRKSDKLSILLHSPKIISIISKYLKQADCFQFRAPTGIGVFVIPYLNILKKKGWFKYAGSWKQKDIPITYRFQKWLLKKQNRIVTINGYWSDQPEHCLSFENPCLTASELELGSQVVKSKNFNTNSLEFCFVGRLEPAKGLDLLIEAFNDLPEQEKLKIKQIHLVGSGELQSFYERKVASIKLPFKFHGLLNRTDLYDIYSKSNFFILPSNSEGFPKVLSEAMNYGSIPIVSNVSSIGHYIDDGFNGFLIAPLTKETLTACLIVAMNLSENIYNSLLFNTRKEIEKFTYKYYNERINEDIIKTF